jgi:hypothetical protein
MVKVREVSELTTKASKTPFVFTEVVPVNPDPVSVIVPLTDCVVGVPELITGGVST